MKKIIRLTESDLIRIVRRIINEGLSVSDTGELIGDIPHPDEKLIKFTNGVYYPIEELMEFMKSLSLRKAEDLFEFGYIKSDNDYGFIKLDKNNGDEVHINGNGKIIITKNDYSYPNFLVFGPFTLNDNDPIAKDMFGEDIHVNEMDVFPDFAMDMTKKGIKKYFYVNVFNW